jgi:hypothetical protein
MSVELTTIRGGINRLRVKGKARADSLYKLTNGYVNEDGSISNRPGTVRVATLPAGTFGLVGFAGKLHVFATSLIAVPDGYVCHVLKHPDDQALKKVHFAVPFLGALYVVAEFANGDIYHFWLQPADAWQANHEYAANEFVTPTTPNGFVYKATRLDDPNPSWAPNVPRTVGDLIEPTVYNEYFYEAVETNGDSPRSASIEPIWPTNTGEQITENSEAQVPDENTSVAPPAPPSGNQPQQAVLDKYMRSIAGRGGVLF